MSENKKYYYLKFKENYFDQDHIKVIESMKNGYEYSLIILKLYLKSLKYEGQLKINEYIPYTKDKIEILSGVLGHDPANVMHALNLAKELQIIEFTELGEIFIADIQSFIGTGSTESDRKKEYRKRIKLSNIKDLTNRTNVRKKSDKIQKVKEKRPPEIEIEIEIEKKINKKKEIELNIKEIIDYLNQKTGKNFRYDNKKTQSCINARLKENYSLDDFKKVVDIKCNHWINDNKMKIYLRPETLFGQKFESYLNQEFIEDKNNKTYENDWFKQNNI